MSILVGTDFSTEGKAATQLAASFARAVRQPLVIIHVLEPQLLFPIEGQPGSVDVTGERISAARKLLAEAEKEVSDGDLSVRGVVVQGFVEDALETAVARHKAVLTVVGGFGRKGKASYQGLAESIAARLSCPVLVARPSSEGISSALAGGRHLRVFMPLDRSLASEAPISWLAWLRSQIPCDVFVDYYYWPPTEHERLGIPAPDEPFAAHPQVVRMLENELRDRLSRIGGKGSLVVSCQPGIGSVGVFAEQASRARDADMVVIGAHRRHGLRRLLHGSVSLDMMRTSDVPVVCVPHDAMRTREPDAIHNIVVATDLSNGSQRCVEYAIDLLGDRPGSLELLYVDSSPMDVVSSRLPGQAHRLTPERTHAIERLLRAQLPEELDEDRLAIHTSVVDGGPVSEAILQTAARVNADAICMSSRGIGAVERALTGSVATDVIQRATCPVLVVKTRAE